MLRRAGVRLLIVNFLLTSPWGQRERVKERKGGKGVVSIGRINLKTLSTDVSLLVVNSAENITRQPLGSMRGIWREVEVIQND